MIESLKKLPPDTFYDFMESPVGKIWIFASTDGIHALGWDKKLEQKKIQKDLSHWKHSPHNLLIKKCKKQLKEYFAGKRTTFDLPLALVGTNFQQEAWEALQKIPFAQTISYQEQAFRLGDKKKCRAVGMANSKNPVAIVVPCHRVIGKSGKLTGYAGGMDKKKFLLELEKKYSPSALL